MEIKESNKTVTIVLVALLLTAIVVALYFLGQYNQTKTLLRQKQVNPAAVANDDKQKLLKDLGKLIELPTEDPSIIATVTDKSKLQNAFFINAQLGDRFIVFAKAEQAILYRPSTNKIIEVGPVSISKVQTTPGAASPTPQVTAAAGAIKIAVYNGTKISGLATATSDKITSSLQNMNVVYTGNAKGDYTDTEIIDVKGGNLEAAAELAKLLSGKVIASLPSGENSNAADIVILVGK